MPYVDFVSRDDRVSLWYTTNTKNSNASSFDPAKPTLIMLHPLFLDSTWLNSQMEDPRLDSNYNLIAFDLRTCGKSNCSLSGAHDSWVDSADLAFAHRALQLPPAHILAIESVSTNLALRLAALFPEMCKSLILVNVPPPTELDWVAEAYTEIARLWCYPEDLDEFEHACLELSQHLLGKDCQPDLQDDIIAYWAMKTPPWRRSRLFETMNCLLNRTPLTADVLAGITQPTLIIQAEKTEMNPVKYAHKLAEDLTNVDGGAKVHIIRGSPEYVTVVPTCASVVNRVVVEFLSRQPQASSCVNMRPSVPTVQRMEAALARLSEFAGDASIATRDPRSPLSFSCVPTELRQSQLDELMKCRKDEKKAFSPLGQDGRPVRKFSERYKDHWFAAERDGVSCSVNSLPEFNHKKRAVSSDSKPVTNYRSPVDTNTLVKKGRIRGATAIAKQVVEIHNMATNVGLSGMTVSHPIPAMNKMAV